MAKIEGILRELLEDTRRYDWEYLEPENGFGMLYCCLKSFGNPNDTLWNLLISSGYPVYLVYLDEGTIPEHVKLCKNIKDVKWFFDEINCVVFENDDGNLVQLRRVIIYLDDNAKPKYVIKLPDNIRNRNPIKIPNVVEFLLERYKKTHDSFSKEFVDAIIRYYTK